MPRSMRSRASPLNLTSLAAMFDLPWLSGFLRRDGAIEHAHDVGFLHDHEVLAIELDLSARPLPEQHAVAAFNVEGVQLAGLVTHTGADGDHLALHGFFLCRVGDKNTAGGFRLRINAANQDAVLQWTQFHRWSPRTRIFGCWHCLVMSANARYPTWSARRRNTT